MNTYQAEYTDTFGGEANYCWVRRHNITVPELTAFGYDGGTNYSKANKRLQTYVMRKAKAAVGITGMRGRTTPFGDGWEFRPYRSCTVLFVTFVDE